MRKLVWCWGLWACKLRLTLITLNFVDAQDRPRFVKHVRRKKYLGCTRLFLVVLSWRIQCFKPKPNKKFKKLTRARGKGFFFFFLAFSSLFSQYKYFNILEILFFWTWSRDVLVILLWLFYNYQIDRDN